VFSQVVTPGSSNFGAWRFFDAATGELLEGTATSTTYRRPGGYKSYERSTRFVLDVSFRLTATSGSGYVRLFDYATGRTHLLRDRRTDDDSGCR
jgi:hypothetical protein